MSARILISRKREFADYLRRYKVIIDGQEKGRIKNGASFECPLAPGRHSLELKIDWCGSETLEFDLTTNQTVRFECGSNLRGWKIFKARKIMRDNPQEWICLKRSSE